MTSALWITIAASALFVATPEGTTRERLLGCPDCIAGGGMPDTLVAYPQGSTIRWSGTKLAGLGKTEGTVALSQGVLVLRHGSLMTGNFTVDMRRLQIADASAADSQARRRVRTQVTGPDVFDVERYPTASLAVQSAKRVGTTTYSVTGDLTLRGMTHPVTFLADVSWPETGHMIAMSTFSIDRRQWGIEYAGSRIANALADDGVQISLTLDARRHGAVVAQH